MNFIAVIQNTIPGHTSLVKIKSDGDIDLTKPEHEKQLKNILTNTGHPVGQDDFLLVFKEDSIPFGKGIFSI